MKRRNFVKNAALGITLPSIFGQGYGARALGLSPMLNELVNAATETNHVLVIIQMNGGNDGLNTVIPLDQYTNLAAARSNILINDTQVLRLNGVNATGLNPAMTGMQTLFNEGKLKVIQSVGYPSPNFSHFRATDIWMSASAANENITSGWMGRYLMSEYPNYPESYPNTTMPDPLAVQIGNELSLTFMGTNAAMGVTISNPTDFVNFVNNQQDPAPSGNMGYELTYLRTIARQADSYGIAMRNAYNRAANSSVAYPIGSSLGDSLKIVARLIKGGMKTRVYMVSVGGFDTHASQVNANDHSIGTHATLLKNVSDSVFAFQRDLEQLQIADKVLGMTFSEFGRRIKSNFSGGTDHGAAAPMFVFGTSLYGGVLGNNPTISATTGTNDNLPMQYDFRSVYASLLKDWFCVNDVTLNSIMLRNFQRLNIVNSPSCITDTHDLNVAAGKNWISNYPNPFDFSTTLEFETRGGYTSIQIFDVEGRLIAMPVSDEYMEGKYKVYFNAEHLPVGTYYARFQNGAVSQVRPLMKVR